MSTDVSGSSVGDTTEEIPVVPAPEGSSADSPDANLFGAAGSLRGLRFNGRTLVRALVLAVWSISLLVLGLVFYGDIASLAPDVPRWWVVMSGVGVGAVVVVILSDVDEPDVEDGTAGHEFHELDWSRKELYSVRPADVAWAAVELFPVVAVAVTVWR